jgi:hypothetical protein
MQQYNDLEIFGIDLGNANTKTASQIIPSGYNFTRSASFLSGDYLFFEGGYFQPSEDRIAKTEDKASAAFLPLVLYALGQELDKNSLIGKREVVLGMGLPPGSMVQEDAPQKLSRNKKLIYSLKTFYKDNFIFKFNKNIFQIDVKDVFVFPQAYSALFSPENLTDKMRMEKPGVKTPYDFLKNEPQALILDFGGVTVDAVALEFGRIAPSKLVSFEWGMFQFYAECKTNAQRNHFTLTDSAINSVLKGENSRLSAEAKSFILAERRDYFSKLAGNLAASGLPFARSYVIFMGGGAQAAMTALDGRDALREAAIDIISDPRANARGFEARALSKLNNNGN